MCRCLPAAVWRMTRSFPDRTHVHWVVWWWMWFPRTAPLRVVMCVTASMGPKTSWMTPRSSSNRSGIEDPEPWQRHDAPPPVATLAQFRHQGTGEVVGEQQRIPRVIGEQPRLIHDGDGRAGDRLPDLLAPRHLAHARDELGDPGGVDQGRGA